MLASDCSDELLADASHIDTTISGMVMYKSSAWPTWPSHIDHQGHVVQVVGVASVTPSLTKLNESECPGLVTPWMGLSIRG